MKDKQTDLDALRAEAEAKITREPIRLANLQQGDELLHELQVHQIELKMQNEELRQAQIALEKSRDRYVDLYDLAPIGYITLSREGMIREINLTASDMLGVVRKKLLSRRFSQFVVTEDRNRWDLHFLSILQHSPQQRCELAFQREDGSRFHAQLNSLKAGLSPSPDELEKASSLPVKDGEAFSVRIVLTDITERIQAEAAIYRSTGIRRKHREHCT